MKQEKTLTLEELRLRISNYKKNKPKHSADSIGMRFETPNNLYFYDTGTGKVFRINAELNVFLYQLLFCDNDVSFLQQMAEESMLNVQEILQYIEDEDLLKGTEGDKLYSDEYLEIAEEERKTKCKQLILELTGACNLRCKYCIYSSSEKGFREFNSENMDRETIRKSIEYLQEYGVKEVYVSFYG